MVGEPIHSSDGNDADAAAGLRTECFDVHAIRHFDKSCLRCKALQRTLINLRHRHIARHSPAPRPFKPLEQPGLVPDVPTACCKPLRRGAASEQRRFHIVRTQTTGMSCNERGGRPPDPSCLLDEVESLLLRRVRPRAAAKSRDA